MSIAYSPPEVRELGTLTALTLGSGVHTGTTTFLKANNTTPDAHTATNPGTKGSPCVNITVPPSSC